MVDRLDGCRGKALADRKPGWTDVLPAFLVLIVGLIGVAVMTLVTDSVPGQYLLVMRPGVGKAAIIDIIYQAKGGVVGFGSLPNLAVAASDDPDFKQAALAGGAFLVLPSPRLLGCFTKTEKAAP